MMSITTVSEDPISNEEQLGDTSSGNFSNSVVFGFFNQNPNYFAASDPQQAVKSVKRHALFLTAQQLLAMVPSRLMDTLQRFQ